MVASVGLLTVGMAVGDSGLVLEHARMDLLDTGLVLEGFPVLLLVFGGGRLLLVEV